MKTKKKVLAALLACLMVFSLLPVTALAADAEPVAQIGETTYTSFSDALDAAKNSSEAVTIKLLGDVETSTLQIANVTYDLNGKTLTYSGASLYPTRGQALSFVDSSVTEAERGGTLLLTHRGVSTTESILCPQAGATVSASNIYVKAPDCSVFYPRGDAAAVNVTNCDVTAACYGVGTNASGAENYGVVITLDGSNITTTSSDGDNTAVIINVEGTLNITDCVITGDRQGVVVRAGTATITDSEVNVTGLFGEKNTNGSTKYQTGAWGSGNEIPSAALTVGNYVNGTAGSYKADATVTVTNTALTSKSDEVPAVYVDANQSYGSSVSISGTTEVTGSVMKGQHAPAEDEDAKVNDITVSGGTFSGDVSGYLADDVQDVTYNTVIKAATCTANGVGKLTKIENGVTTTSYYVIPAAHKWVVDEQKSVAATCGADGKTAYKCSVCDETKEETIEATGKHGTPTEKAVDATCTEAAKIELICPTCQTVLNTIEVTGSEPLGHDPVETVTKAATCTEAGKKTITCSRAEACGYEAQTVEIPATGHTWNENEEIVAADCTRGASVKRTCTKCEATEVVEFEGELAVPALGHDLEAVVTPPTCQDQGYTTYTCKREGCTYSYTDDYVDANGDAHVEKLVEPALKPATCTENGIGKYVCAKCGTTLGYKIIPASHTWGEEPTNTTSATCTTPGEKTYTCTVKGCGVTKKEEIPALGHSYGEGETTKEATCGEAGVTTYTCSQCTEGTEGHSYTVEIPATGKHTYEEYTVDATCTEPAMAGEKCENCGALKGEPSVVEGSKPLGHSWVLDEDAEGNKAATCVEDGVAVYTCKNDGCGETKTEKIDATGKHTDEYVEEKDPTCVEDGYTEGVKCSVCGEILYGMEKIPATDIHTEVEDAAVAATCMATGLTKGSHCSVCDKVIVEQKVTEKIPHNYTAVVAAPTCKDGGHTTYTCSYSCGESYVADETPIDPDAHNYVKQSALKEATCTTTGIGKYVCSICGATKYMVIPAEHTWGEGKVTTEASCTTEGVKTYTCSACNEIETETIEKTAHNWGGWETITKVTCGTAGEKKRTCSACSAEETEPIEATGKHNYIEDVVAATCTENAKVAFVCSVCGAVDPDREQVEVPDSMIAHDYETVTVDATCTKAGSITKTCKVCKDTVTEEIPATGEHTDDVVEAKAPTCVEDGYTAGVKCSVCGEILFGMEPISATGEHTIVEDEAVAPTCNTPGKTAGSHCSVCDKVFVAQEEIPADPNAHEYKLGNELKAATCSATGIGKYTCENCGATKYATIEKTAHTFDEANATITTEPTCTEEGALTLTCTNCGATETRPIKATGHSWSEEKVAEDNSYVYKECTDCGETDIIQYIDCEHAETELQNQKDATCTEEGYTGDTVCTKCGETVAKGEVIDALGHKEEVIEGKDATCTETGLTDGVKCSVCGEVLKAQEEISMTEHSLVDDAAVAPTCTEAGKAAGKHCENCDYTEGGAVIDALGHTVVTDAAVAATCTSTGLTEGSHCSVCGEVIVAQQEIPVTEHTVVVDEAVAATCTSTGLTEGSHCSACQTVLVEQEQTPMAAHVLVDDAAVAPTCTEAGKAAGKHCENCDYTEGGEAIPATGHSLVDDAAIEPTCTEAGKEAGKHCQNCDYTEGGEVLDALGHSTELRNAKDATCTEDGYTGDTVCTVCSETVAEGKVIDALGHTEETIPGYPATETEDGLTDGVKCSVCGTILTQQEVIPATGPAECKHLNTTTGETVQPTCGTEGHYGDTVCLDCGETIETGSVIPATGVHHYSYTSYTDDEGNLVEVYTCPECGDRFEERP